MDLKAFEKDGVSIIKIHGEININTSPDLKKIFEKDRPKKIIVDLEQVTYIDSSGLATLVEMLKKTKSQSGNFGLAHVSDKVRSLFEITKLDKLFSIYPTQDEAVDKIK